MSMLFALILALVTPCEYEDSTNCHWDASRRGNGLGYSFVALDVDMDGADDFVIRYADTRYDDSIGDIVTTPMFGVVE